MDCIGGNDKDIDACVEEARGDEEQADAYDCGDEYSDLFDCAEENASCKNGNFSTGNDCKDQAEALSKCVKAASAKD